VNDRQVGFSGNVFDGNERVDLSCECGAPYCGRLLTVTRERYEEIRWSPITFVVAPGHVVAGDRVVELCDGHVVVAVEGEAAELVSRPAGNPAPVERLDIGRGRPEHGRCWESPDIWGWRGTTRFGKERAGFHGP
jgi:hypothetical protein